ncbi:hypothetical protein AFEL58S_02069 [Afipia felis]
MSTSKIEWTDATWNPVVGCSIATPGCTNCYAMRMARRLNAMHVAHYTDTTKTVNGNAVWTGKVALAPDSTLTQPLRWKRARKIFVNSMGDLFHESVSDEWIDRVFAVMALCPQHTFQVLTKRSARMRAYMNGLPTKIPFLGRMPLERIHLEAAGHMEGDGGFMNTLKRHGNVYSLYLNVPWPLPNVWLGVSCEDQQRADERIPDLLATPAAIRFVSAEPLLGPIDVGQLQDGLPNNAWLTWLDELDWVIVGGESGPGARPIHPDWVRGLRDQCTGVGVPFFFKQWGAYQPLFPQYADEFSVDETDMVCDGVEFPCEGVLYRNGHFYDGVAYQPHVGEGAYWVSRVGKRAAGRLLDGVEHNGMPGVAA